ncbi:PREDICTED: LOW QUALITY PROTEIN: T-cell surface antigen CD2 [Apaloderma vittatum]|uniref:LOW QUALITY PROTEIN: T-cell surface antigen CD2 n=1 Tax=Apaloderma vittatum TaxID=57397 RepID=UPI000521A3F5|nr:PREDICTED: LOW QUALITY PROTEIN: T-cell surface antigen CD2 [Apaloderma vittatum]
MNLRRIFLVKCLLLLFPSVKCSDTNPIYKAVNGSALLNITAAPRSVYDATWLRDRRKLLQIKANKVKYYMNKEQCRCKIFPNGTLQLQQLVKEDSGKYTVTVYQQDGKLQAEEDIMFIVQERVPHPILIAECINKTVSVKCEVKQKTKEETFILELTHDKTKKIQKNVTKLELHTRHSGKFTCIVKNEVDEKRAEKVVKCSGQLDFYLILSIAGGAIFFVIFMILLIYCIRKKKAKRLGDDGKFMGLYFAIQPPRILELPAGSSPVGRSMLCALA